MSKGRKKPRMEAPRLRGVAAEDPGPERMGGAPVIKASAISQRPLARAAATRCRADRRRLWPSVFIGGSR